MDNLKFRKIVETSSSKSNIQCYPVSYLDFDNPDHGFLLLDSNPVLTKGNLLTQQTLKKICQKDPVSRTALDRCARKLEKRASKVPDVEEDGQISPFLALLDALPEENEDDDTGGVESEDDGEAKVPTVAYNEVEDAQENEVHTWISEKLEGMVEESRDEQRLALCLPNAGASSSSSTCRAEPLPSSSAASSSSSGRDVISRPRGRGRPRGSKNLF